MENRYYYTVSPENSLNIWKYDEAEILPYESPIVPCNREYYRQISTQATSMEDISRIVYPVREKFLKDDKISDIKYIDKKFSKLYFPWENRKVNFSTFCHNPAVLGIYARCYIKSEKNQRLSLQLITCGAVKMWVNKKEKVLFKPYKRNVPTSHAFQLELSQGENEILIYANDLAERDVFFYFELINKSEKDINVYVPLKQKQEDINSAQKILESLYFEKDSYYKGKVKLFYDSSILKNELKITYGPNEVQGILTKDKNYIVLADLDNPDDKRLEGVNASKFLVSTNIDGLDITRTLFVAVYSKAFKAIEMADTIEGRKKQTLKLFSDTTPDRFCATVLAILEVQMEFTPLCREILESELSRIEKKLDCSDFRLPIILLTVYRYSHLIPQDILDRIKKVALSFRYWIDEPGNDVMWFFSENHAMLFHTCQYIAGYLYTDEVFTTSNRSSKDQEDYGYKRLIKWFDEFLNRGYEEWNSLTYLPVDFIGFFTLYEMAKHDEIKQLAKKGLDMTFEIIASNLHNTIFSTSYGRIYEDYLKSVEFGELSMYSWIAYGQGSVNNRNKATVLFACSSYIPPDFKSLRDLSNNKVVTIERIQGFHKVYTYIHKRKEYSIAAALGYYPFSKGLQQHMFNLSFSEDEIPIWINHPGESVFSGENRPSYWAGNGSIPYVEQYKNIVMMGYELSKEDDVKYIHAYLPLGEMEEYRYDNNWFVFKKKNAYGGIYFLRGSKITDYGANCNKELISNGLQHGVIIKCSTSHEYSSFEEFVSSLTKSRIEYYSPRHMLYEDSQHGKFEMKYTEGLKLNNKMVERKAVDGPVVTIK